MEMLLEPEKKSIDRTYNMRSIVALAITRSERLDFKRYQANNIKQTAALHRLKRFENSSLNFKFCDRKELKPLQINHVYDSANITVLSSLVSCDSVKIHIIY